MTKGLDVFGIATSFLQLTYDRLNIMSVFSFLQKVTKVKEMFKATLIETNENYDAKRASNLTNMEKKKSSSSMFGKAKTDDDIFSDKASSNSE